MKKEERAKIDEYLKGIVLSLPDSPGCYQYLNEKGVIIYVGKAKRLKQRVSSYFHKEVDRFITVSHRHMAINFFRWSRHIV